MLILTYIHIYKHVYLHTTHCVWISCGSLQMLNCGKGKISKTLHSKSSQIWCIYRFWTSYPIVSLKILQGQLPRIEKMTIWREQKMSVFTKSSCSYLRENSLAAYAISYLFMKINETVSIFGLHWVSPVGPHLVIHLESWVTVQIHSWQIMALQCLQRFLGWKDRIINNFITPYQLTEDKQ